MHVYSHTALCVVMLDSAVVTYKLHFLVRLLSHQSGFVVCFLRFVKGLMIHAFSAGAREPMHCQCPHSVLQMN